jgi:hypothetical protein
LLLANLIAGRFSSNLYPSGGSNLKKYVDQRVNVVIKMNDNIIQTFFFEKNDFIVFRLFLISIKNKTNNGKSINGIAVNLVDNDSPIIIEKIITLLYVNLSFHNQK